MRRILKFVGLALAAIILVAAATLTVIWVRGPARRPVDKTLVFARTPERIAHGKYLAEQVSGCMSCHSEVDHQVWSTPPMLGVEHEGIGRCWDRVPEDDAAFQQITDWFICPPNITPDPVYGIGAWTDDELARAIREQVERDDSPLYIFHEGFEEMSDEDVQSIVAFLRTLPPSQNKVPKTKISIFTRFMVAFTGPDRPHPILHPIPTPDRKDSAAYGRYLVQLADCKECHTKRDDDTGKPIPGREFAGGEPFLHSVYSANLTPDPTGLLAHTKANFISMFRAYSSIDRAQLQVSPQHNSPMPWVVFSALSDEDLSSIYDYLRTVKPVHNVVEKMMKPDQPADGTQARQSP